MNLRPNWLASRNILAVGPDGRHIEMTLRLGIPYEISSEEWACAVAIEGLREQLPNIHGIDAWQALQLAQHLQVQLLSHFVDEGGKLAWPGSFEPIRLENLFPYLPHQ